MTTLLNGDLDLNIAFLCKISCVGIKFRHIFSEQLCY